MKPLEKWPLWIQLAWLACVCLVLGYCVWLSAQ